MLLTTVTTVDKVRHVAGRQEDVFQMIKYAATLDIGTVITVKLVAENINVVCQKPHV